MRQWASTSAKSLLLAAGFVALGSGVAFADSGAATSGNGSLAGGNQAVVNGDVPVNLSGNAVGAVGGIAGANATDTGAGVKDHGDSDIHSSGNGSVLGGNQLVGDLDVPVNATGNAVGALGGAAGANATDTGAGVEHQSAPTEHQSAPSDVSATDVLDEAAENAELLPAADTSGVDAGVLQQSAPKGGHDHSIATSGNGSLLGGNQAVVDGDVPVNLSGNAISALGVSGANATDTGAGVKDHHNDVRSSGNGSVLGGNQLVGDLDVPVNATGNGIGVLGAAGANATDTGAGVEHQSATEEQSALEGLPVVDELPEVPVSEQLPVDHELEETQEPAAEETPLDEAPAEEAPLDEAPAEEAPVEEAPVEEAPAEEAPVEEAPAEETPLEEAPEMLEGAELPEAPAAEQGNPVDALLGATGLGL
ncbi:hypothetical protein [Nocardiopsis salina]|uniref:hypothetical protein n=1 Tax=Nocardiopsis salina TaxID=245836 RepID=UPI00034B39A1|nr:hypothetical protein [Nocardiopsis salina]